MIKKTITYTDYNGTERTEAFYFNLTKSELAGMQSNYVAEKIQSIIESANRSEIVKIFQEFITLSYGIKSDDGKFFEKTPEATRRFQQSPAYEALFEELTSDATLASEFFNGIMPADVQKQIKEQKPALNA